MNYDEAVQLLEKEQRENLIEYLERVHGLDFQRLCGWLTSYRSTEIWSRKTGETLTYFKAHRRIYDRGIFTGDRNASFDQEMTWLHDFVLNAQQDTSLTQKVHGIDFYPVMDIMLWLLVEVSISSDSKGDQHNIEFWMQWVTFILRMYHRQDKRLSALWSY